MKDDVMLISLVVAECAYPVKECAGGLEDKLRAAMITAKDHWMVLDRDTQFRGAIGAVMQHYGEDSDEYRRLSHEVKMLARINAFIAAAQAGLSPTLPDDDEEKPEPVGLMKIWQEVTA